LSLKPIHIGDQATEQEILAILSEHTNGIPLITVILNGNEKGKTSLITAISKALEQVPPSNQAVMFLELATLVIEAASELVPIYEHYDDTADAIDELIETCGMVRDYVAERATR